jgi:hypothetical protein
MHCTALGLTHLSRTEQAIKELAEQGMVLEGRRKLARRS